MITSVSTKENKLEQFRLAKYAMGTRWEMVLNGKDAAYLQGVGEAAFEELERLERQLSFYREESDISQINRHAYTKPVVLEPRLFALFKRAIKLHEETEGAFDITMAPLLRCWGFIEGTGEMPSEEALSIARAKVGMEFLLLDADRSTARFLKPDMEIDLGAIGKGYALDRMTEHLQDMGVTSALIHGGTSSVSAMGSSGADGRKGWEIAIAHPTEEGKFLASCTLLDNTLSVSSPRHKSFQHGGLRYGHVINPSTGEPATGNFLAAIVGESATEGDALSTALLVTGKSFLTTLDRREGVSGSLFLSEEAQKFTLIMGDHSSGVFSDLTV